MFYNLVRSLAIKHSHVHYTKLKHIFIPKQSDQRKTQKGSLNEIRKEKLQYVSEIFSGPPLNVDRCKNKLEKFIYSSCKKLKLLLFTHFLKPKFKL